MRSSLIITLLVMAFYTNGYSQCNTSNATSCACKDSTSSDCDLLPDMIVAEPPLLVQGSSGIIEYSQSGNGSNNGLLRISVSTPNIGYGPLEVRTTNTYVCGTDTIVGTAPSLCPNTGLPPKQLIVQRVYHKNGSTMTWYDREAGSMTYHPSHGHMHVDDWGVYTLRTMDSTESNPLNWPIVGTGAKLAFCLMDYGSCSTYNGHCVDSAGNTLVNGDFPNYGLGGGSYNCSSIVQGISSGWTDIYYQHLDGMYIQIPPGTCNGQYYIVVHLDPYNYFIEENESNNVLVVPYTLTQQISGTTASVTATHLGTICSSDSITLTANGDGLNYTYLWNTGATTQSITTNVQGNYTVEVSSTCGTATSSAFPVTVIAPPPTTVGNALCGSGSDTLYALNSSGTTNWYDLSSGGSLVGNGNTFITPFTASTTTWYASASEVISGFSGNAQPSDNLIGAGTYSTGNQYLIFDAYRPFTLVSVKVYAQTSGSRTIELRNSGGTLLLTKTVNVPSGQSRITLNWPIPAGTNMRLTRSGTTDFYRNSSGVNYPYTIPTILSITGSSAGSSYYYFFYDWEVTTPSENCESIRVPATLTINTPPVVTAPATVSVCDTGAAILLGGGSPSGGFWIGPFVGINGHFDQTTAGPGIYQVSYVYYDLNGCIDSAHTQITVTTCGCITPATPSKVKGLLRPCPGTVSNYSTLDVPGATTYNWSVPSHVSIVAGAGNKTVALSFDSLFISGSVCVTAENNCGVSSMKCKTIYANTSKRTGIIQGNLYGNCNTPVSLSVDPVAGAIQYNWYLPAGASNISGQGTTSIMFDMPAGFISDQVCVRTYNGCMESNPRCKTIYAAPQKPSAILGPDDVCQNQTGVNYSVNPVYGATNYLWAGPAGSTIVSGQGTPGVVVDFGTSAGKMVVVAKNNCGKIAARSLNVSMSCRVTETTDPSISIAPNPTSGYIEITIGDKEDQAVVNIFDLLGKSLYAESIALHGSGVIPMDLSYLNKGMYLIQVKTSKHTEIIRMVIE